MPPAVALINYISSGKEVADFFPNWDISRGFLYIAGRISAAALEVGDNIFLSSLVQSAGFFQ